MATSDQWLLSMVFCTEIAPRTNLYAAFVRGFFLSTQICSLCYRRYKTETVGSFWRRSLPSSGTWDTIDYVKINVIYSVFNLDLFQIGSHGDVFDYETYLTFSLYIDI